MQLQDAHNMRGRLGARVPHVAVRAQAGFTLAETMIALLIFVLLTMVVAMGIPSAFNAYRTVVEGSNAQMALSTTTTVLRDELTMASEVQLGTAGDDEPKPVVSYRSAEGYWVKLVNTSAAKGEGLKKEVYKGDDSGPSGNKVDTVDLIPKSAVTSELKVLSGDGASVDITYKDGVFCVNGLKVLSGDRELASISVGSSGENVYKVRAVNNVSEV